MHPNPVQIVEDLYGVFRRRDKPTVFSLLSPDIEITQSEDLLWGGLYRGYEGARQFVGKLGAHLNSTLDVERLISAADHAVAVGWTEGTVNATGASYRVPIAHIAIGWCFHYRLPDQP